MKEEVRMVGNCKFNIRTYQEVIKLVTSVSRR